MSPLAILIGPPGAGKSTVGRLLAARLGTRFTDTDELVEQRVGKPVADIFISDGEPAFRELERSAVASALDRDGEVVGLGGGAVMDPRTQSDLTGQPVVYLETGFAELTRRVGLNTARPLLLRNPRAQLKALLEERLPTYARLAWRAVPTDGRDPGEVAEWIADEIGTR